MIPEIPLLLGGLMMFLYSIRKLSEVLEGIFEEKTKKVIATYTSNLFYAISLGGIITVLMGSSSAVIIITIVFINAKTLNFRQAIGIIMGANIGTTISSQIIALDVSQYACILLMVGMLLMFFAKRAKHQQFGSSLLYFGMLFFGLFLMEESMSPLRDDQFFLDWITKLENPVRGAMAGALITLIIQSSSATVGLVITLGKQNLISLAGGIAVMLGAELGTCSDTLLATIKGTRQSIKAGLFHLLFNLITIFLGLLFFNPFVDFIDEISIGSLSSTIANAHLIFNLLGVLLFIPLVRITEKALNKLLPDRVSA
ncbi:MAG: Na/Pi symporter [Bacteroidota bacterium]